jgi:VIT1/CCC1 family predicted Fe2+/Mn2+ transporter
LTDTSPSPARSRPAAVFAALRREGRAGPPPSPHDTPAQTVLRPIVFGANDGLVSNLALVMGVAGATSKGSVIVLAGIAGLLAGAFSMAVGEYISVRSQRELLDRQLVIQHRQMLESPEEERAILARAYRQRGLTEKEADRFAERIFADSEKAIELLIFEEVGMDVRSIGSPASAAMGSFLAFVLGAVIPLIPYLLLTGSAAFATSLLASLVALFVLGLGISRLTGRNPLFAGTRQLLLGGVAAIVTFGVGTLIGVSGI